MVHLTDANHIRSIRRVGLKRTKFRWRPVHGLDAAVFAMPVLPDYYVSHQWLRELRRRGIRRLVGVHFRLGPREKVVIGHYGRDHTLLGVGEATKLLLAQADPRGWEMLIPRDIAPKEILAVRDLPQVVGWRVSPTAKGTTPCGCDMCQRGELKGRRIIERRGEARSPRLSKTAMLALVEGARDPLDQQIYAENLLSAWRWSGYRLLAARAFPAVKKVLEDWLAERMP